VAADTTGSHAASAGGTRISYERAATARPCCGSLRDTVLHRPPQACAPGLFRRVVSIKDAKQRFLDAWNERKHPFAGLGTADQVLRRYNQTLISGPVH
jgi:hypothetical protein